MINIYDNNGFFEAYSNMPRSKQGLAAAGEWTRLKKLFPDLNGKKVLDLGCGYGWHCKYAVENGASKVVGIDASHKMIAKANADNLDSKIKYQVCGIEDYLYEDDTYDFVISNLALHYIENLEKVYSNVYRTLKTGGVFLFNIEHPVFTAGINQDWIYNQDGTALYWPIDNYYYPGERQTCFLGQKVTKFHHTLTQILNPLLKIGFQIETIEEAVPPDEILQISGMSDEMRRPMMLLVKVRKI